MCLIYYCIIWLCVCMSAFALCLSIWGVWWCAWWRSDEDDYVGEFMCIDCRRSQRLVDKTPSCKPIGPRRGKSNISSHPSADLNARIDIFCVGESMCLIYYCIIWLCVCMSAFALCLSIWKVWWCALWQKLVDSTPSCKPICPRRGK